ncbi:MAG TPA: AMP-binding protein [Verrucomicrobiae bacterium]|nr:AMP-binding protein [Verrucomicrobiae bacterium]
MNIAEIILAKGEDSAPALLQGDAVVTWAQLREAVVQVAHELLARGRSPGDRIGLFSENSSFFVASYLGIIRAGMVVVPFPTELTQPSFDRIISDAGITEVFVSRRFLNRIRPWVEKRGIALTEEASSCANVQSAGSRLTATPSPGYSDARGGDELAALMFTSGSTGAPKGVMVSHRNIECNSRDIINYLGLTAADRAMVVLPFHYCFGLSLLHTHLMAGASLVLNNNFKLYPETVLQEMEQRECTGLAGVPSTYQFLLHNSRFRNTSFPKLRWFQQAGGKLPDACIREVLDAFPPTRFFLMYGQTEATARLSYLAPEDLRDKLGSIGKGLPSTRLEVLKADGSPVVPGSTETGEIVASGDNITLGYWNDPLETSKYFRNRKLYTGDIARVDADGFIYIVGRERGMIKSGGNRVSAEEVEGIIAELPGVVEVAVVGVPHELLGEAIKAFVVTSAGIPALGDAVLHHCRQRLPAFKVPEEVVFLSELPHNSSGKVIKSRLKDLNTARAYSEAVTVT